MFGVWPKHYLYARRYLSKVARSRHIILKKIHFNKTRVLEAAQQGRQPNKAGSPTRQASQE